MQQDNNPEQTEQREASFEQAIEALLARERHGYLGNLMGGLIHNINGPLQNISMLVEMIMRGQEQLDRIVQGQNPQFPEEYGKISGKQKQRYQWLTQQINVLAEILRDFMVLKEIERNDSEVDLKLVLSKIARVFNADLFLKHQVQLEIQLEDNLPLVRILGRDLIPALINLLQNALTAVRENPEKKVVIECRRVEDKVQIVFRDSGCGFAADQDMDRLFDLFYSNWPETVIQKETAPEHFGFGLYAVRRFLDPYGVEVRLGRGQGGTAAIVEIPIRG